MCGTRKEFSGDTYRGLPLGAVEASEESATRWSAPRRGAKGPQESQPTGHRQAN